MFKNRFLTFADRLYGETFKANSFIGLLASRGQAQGPERRVSPTQAAAIEVGANGMAGVCEQLMDAGYDFFALLEDKGQMLVDGEDLRREREEFFGDLASALKSAANDNTRKGNVVPLRVA